MTQENDETRIIDLSEEEDETEPVELTEDDENAEEGEEGSTAPGEKAEPKGEATASETPQPDKPELKIVIRLDEKITVGIQGKETYPVFYTLEESEIEALGEPIAGLVRKAKDQWDKQPQLNKYDAKKSKTKPSPPAGTLAATTTTKKPPPAPRPKNTATTQSGPKLL